MKKLMNNPAHIIDEMIDGLTKSNAHLVERIENTTIVIRKNLPAKVGLISGGGSGHEPAHAGFVGQGMLTAAVCGQVFTSPSPDQILTAIHAADKGHGVFMVVKNYSGDIMNFEMAKDLAEMDGIEIDYCIVADDIAVENSTYTQGRRGVAGTVLVHKILGAAIDQGATLAEVKSLSDTILPNIKTIGVAFSGATVPEVGKPGFVLPDDEIEYGVGIHGEPGYRREKLQSSADLAKELVNKLNDEFNFKSGDNYALLINGLGSTTLMEQYVFANDIFKLLTDAGIKICFSQVGNYMTAIDMAGASLTLMKLDDAKWTEYLNYRVNTVAW
ncbi:dihydroxyacetone kinase subunit DhaK [Orbus sturtevantii]|uniref:dihydroxyacetone kinase subunit DhaK n=1 Tax=Orbus sturtevantii TaxID=3074109 RepID=UPI00370DB833